MSNPQFAIVRLTAAHDRTDFVSGDEPLDRFIKEQAVQAMRDRACAVFVATAMHDPTHIIGYYTLSPATVSAEGVPDDLRARLPRYPELPAALLGRLAVHEAYAGRGLGSLLVANALRHTEAQRELPVMFLVVDAYAQARGFYQKLGFVPVMNSQARLFIALSRLSRGAALTPEA
ncbi:MAG: GNAT family N-acetyltransferase [Thermomicrobiales bacterium]